MMAKLKIKNCAVNTATFGFQAPLSKVIEEVARAGFGAIAPWRREVEGHDLKALAKQICDAGLKVTGYCRSDYFSGAAAARKASLKANIKALDEAAELGASHFTLVVGTGRDLPLARSQVEDGVAQLLEHARDVGVRLALEPLHPVYAADRACINTIAQGLAMCQRIEGKTRKPMLGLLVDAYHVWWDPALEASVKAAGHRIFGFHVSDWLMPVRDVLNDRGMMGDGVIDLPTIRGLVETAGYKGFTEVEIFSTENWWKKPMYETCRVMKERLISRV